MLELVGVSKTYREGGSDRVVFEDLDVVFEAHRFTAIMGRSGSGKSTLLNLASGMDLPDRGQVLLGGRDLAKLSEHQRTLLRRTEIGLVFQFFNLIPTLTVEENLLLPLELAGTARDEARRRARSRLHDVGLSDRGAAFPDRLSGGEQQRVAVARALVNEPPFILADEPTGNLDEDTGREVLALLTGLVRRRGHTLLMATHSEEAARAADEVLTISHHGMRARVAAPDRRPAAGP